MTRRQDEHYTMKCRHMAKYRQSHREPTRVTRGRDYSKSLREMPSFRMREFNVVRFI
jgi:hypothetical protein